MAGRAGGNGRPGAGDPALAGGKAPALVACHIGAAYWFTASTSFANPAAVFGRLFSDSFAGISPSSAVAFTAAELLGAALGAAVHRIVR